MHAPSECVRWCIACQLCQKCSWEGTLPSAPWRRGTAGGAKEEDINAELGVGSVAADAELDAMKEEVGREGPVDVTSGSA